MLQLVNLAPLNFADLLNTDVYMSRKVLGQVVILGVFGIFPSVSMMCTFVVYALPCQFTLTSTRAWCSERCSLLPTPFWCSLA